MRNFFKQIRIFYKRNKYAGIVTFFLALFLLPGAFIYLFERIGNKQEFTDIFDGWWWAIITFSTTGYGDKVPISSAGRVTAVMTILIGIGAMSVLSGTLASIFVERNTLARRGLMDFRKKSGHFIICGWKDHMKDILLDIISVIPKLGSSDIILISNVDQEKIEELKEEKNLENLNYVRGDYFSESSLKRANVKAARKIVILADTFESTAISEVDSKTVMTVITVKALSKDVYTCAELLDKKYENYLKHAMCDEIIYSRDFSRRIIASTSAINGMSHIIQDLLAHEKSNSRLTTNSIPKEWIGKSYGSYKKGIGYGSEKIFLGILENTGSPNKIKIEALREAQKTSDISRLVSNLQTVKGIEVNKPMLIPDDDYVIQAHSKSIILERR